MTANVTLFAQWTALPTYSLTYDGNTNTLGTVPATVTGIVSGTSVTVAAAGTLTKTNYAFAGWNTAANGSGTSYAAGASITMTANVTLFAQWTALPTYSLTYNGNTNTGGTVPATVTGIVSGTSVTAAAAGTLVKTCNTFSKWNTLANGSGTSYLAGASITITGNMTLYAQWTVVAPYTVTFYSPNQNAVYSTSSVSCGSTVSAPAAPTQTCSTFTAWYQNTGHTSPYIFSSQVMGNLALYAGWTTKTNLVTFHTGTSAVIPPQSVPCGGKATTPTNPYLSCNNFGGWYTDQTYSTQWNFNNIVTSPMDLYAKWTPSVSITDPVNATMCSVGSATLSVTGTGATAYQWYDDQGNQLSDNKYYNGTQTANLNFVFMPSGTSSYYCIASNGSCYSPASQPATLTVNPLPTNDNIINTSWSGISGGSGSSQGAGNDPNGDFWVELNPPAGTTEWIIITNNVEPGFSGTHSYTTQAYPEVCSGFFGPNEPAGTFTVEFWTVSNSTGCQSDHSIWTNPAYVP
jgi:uncharacterized repeat protein (TIGR02543 family)